MTVAGARVAIVGLGTSGVAAAKLCRKLGAREVCGFDERAETAAARVHPLRQHGVALSFGPLPALSSFDLVVVSPGVPPRPALDDAAAAGREVIGEMELGSRFVEAPIALVGGTNGKSTVTAWLAEMLREAGRRPFVGGNFGTPLSAFAADDDPSADVLVLEISSFQAERVPTLRARTHTLLNISEDHLDRYPSFSAYADAKGNPFVNMTSADHAVIPAGDATVARQAARGPAPAVTFGVDGGGDVRVEGSDIVATVPGRGPTVRFPVRTVGLAGRHNLSNACAAVATAMVWGVEAAAIERALGRFRGLPHRSSPVAAVDGVTFYDDSKATNVGAAVAAVDGLEEARVVLIAGGRDKGGSYAPLIEAMARRGRGLVLVGEATAQIASAAADRVLVRCATNLDEAVTEAAAMARPGDAVLLSPACSSFDMFDDYRARGEAFVRAVRALDGAAGDAERGEVPR
ncbi:MAG: UDP-N-acetylmuramoyl-L-alanine--D-glutamate ligase [Myxococcota bacterium]